MGKVRVQLLGTTTVTTSTGGRVTKFGGVKPRQLLGLLAVEPGRVMAKDKLADQIWDGAPPRAWQGTLESYVCVLRRAMGSAGRDSVLRTTNTGYQLDPDRVVVDVVELRRLLKRAAAATSTTQRIGLAELAVDLAAHGELLASEDYAPWAVEHRGLLTRDLVHACVSAADVAHQSGAHAAAIRLARTSVARDRLAEPGWQVLMAALAAQDRHGEALRAYAQLREVLADELGIEPSAGCRGVYLNVLRSRPASRSDRGELSTLMHLLRQTLEGVPGLVVPSEDGALSQVAVRVLAQSAVA